MTRVLLAFDKFKDALTAPEAVAAAVEGLRAARPDWILDRCPLADGGEGFGPILTGAAGGTWEARTVTGPRGQPVRTGFGVVPLDHIPAAARNLLDLPATRPDARIAVIEMAGASGLALLPPDQRDPWRTTSVGTGELLRAAADQGVDGILLGIGGSATHDLGLGALAALGLRAIGSPDPAAPAPHGWEQVVHLEGNPAALPPVRIACDVTNPLLGARGAASVYAPQKGLRPEDHARLEHATARMALLLCHATRQPDTLMDQPGTGAAGGISFGLMAALHARLLPGYPLVSAWLDLEARIAAADIVVTGEGRFDASSLEGKGPGAVAARALEGGRQVHVFAGQVGTLAHPALHLHAITPAGTPLADALRDAGRNLAGTVRGVFQPD